MHVGHIAIIINDAHVLSIKVWECTHFKTINCQNWYEVALILFQKFAKLKDVWGYNLMITFQSLTVI